MNDTSTSSSFNNATLCDPSSACCKLENLRVGNVNLVNGIVVALVFLSILAIMFRIQGSALRAHLPVYYNYLLLTCATFLIVILLQLLPLGTDSPLLLTILMRLLIAPEWIVQCSVVFFLLASKADNAAGLRAFWQATGMSVALIVIDVVPLTISADCSYCGAVVSHVLVSAFFLCAFALSFQSSRRARPALRQWSAYLLFAHLVFLLHVILLQWLPTAEVTSCFNSIAVLLFYALYTPVLLLTVSADTAYWRTRGALMQHYAEEEAHENVEPDAAREGSTLRLKNALNSDNLASTYASSTQTNVIDFAELEVGGVLGVGQFGVVHEGTFRQQPVAVKLLRQLPSSAISEVMRDLLRESRLLLALRSDYVVGCVGVILDDQHLGLVTELMEISLWDALHNTNEPDVTTPWPLERTVAIMTDVARGLQYLHSQQPPIIHRDIKSANILIKFNGRTVTQARPTAAPAEGAKRQLAWSWPADELHLRPVAKLCDLGVSRAKLETAHMTRVGTAQWAAVELLLGQPYNEKVDIFSFGVVWWECLARKKPFASMSAVRVVAAVAVEHLRLPLPADAPAPLAALIKRMWDASPSKRPSASEIVHEIKR
jgi:hypothetical protein